MYSDSAKDFVNTRYRFVTNNSDNNTYKQSHYFCFFTLYKELKLNNTTMADNDATMEDAGARRDAATNEDASYDAFEQQLLADGTSFVASIILEVII